MFAFLRGTLASISSEYVVLDVQGVGYRVFTCEDIGAVGTQVLLFVHEVIREDRFDLYGFLSEDMLGVFEAFLNVQGVGPKMALKILAAGSPDVLRRALFASDVDFFTRISGVGKKTAQKIILDLRGVLTDGSARQDADEVVDALVAFGYAKHVILDILPHVTGSSLEERVKSGLRLLTRAS